MSESKVDLKSKSYIYQFYVKVSKKETKIIAKQDETYHMDVAAPPVDGKANEEILSFLSKRYKIPLKQIELVKGHKSKQKLVRVIGERPRFDPLFGPLAKEDYYTNENGFMVFTEQYHLKRGYCCGSGCLHCPYKKDRLF